MSKKKKKKKTPAVKFLDLIFAITFLSSILAKCVRDESCRGEQAQDLLEKFICDWHPI